MGMNREKEAIIHRAAQRQNFFGKAVYTAKEAACLSECSKTAVVNWCIRHGIGIKIGAEWLVDGDKLLDLQRQRALVAKSYRRRVSG